MEKFEAAGFSLNKGEAAQPQRPLCPKCGSINTQFLRGENLWVCRSTKGSRVPLGGMKRQCGHKFAAPAIS
jgi:ribosomal protein L37AE/L43A